MAEDSLPIIDSELTAIAPSNPAPPGSFYSSPAQHRARAKILRRCNPKSRAAELHELAARAIERRLAGQVSGCALPQKGGVAALSEEQERSHACAAKAPTRFAWDGAQVLAVIFLVLVYWPLWPVAALWLALLAIIRLIESLAGRSRRHGRS